MKFKTWTANVFVSLTMLWATSAMAQSAGDTVVSAGWLHITEEHDSFLFSTDSIGSANTLNFSLSRFLTDHWAVAVDMGLPSKSKLRGDGFFMHNVETGTAKRWAPTVSANYYFRDAQATFRPFAGLGVARISYSVDSYEGQGITHIDSAWAPVANIGATYAINQNWYAGFTMSLMSYKRKDMLGSSFTQSPRVFPLTTYLNLGYRF